MTRSRSVSVLAVLLLMITVSGRAQRFGEAVQVTIVEVPVKVVSSEGDAVRNLTKEDFELYDDGKRVPIEYFETLDMKVLASEPEKPNEPLPPAATRHFLLLFDLANSSPGTIQRASSAAKEFVQKELGTHDLAAVAVFTAETGAKMITNFTKDRTLLLNAVETLGHPSYFKVGDPLMISAVRTGTGDASGPGGEGGGRSGADQALAEMSAELNKMSQDAHDSELRSRLNIQLSNFGRIARTLDRLPGQKQVILLSEGFDARLVQGREDLSFEKTREAADQVMSGEVWKVDNEQRFGNVGSANAIDKMAELFRRSDVTLHAIDIKGLRSDVDASAGVKRVSNESLFLLTKPTGGTVFKNGNDLGANFDRLMKQQEVVYLLGFPARSTGKPGKFHELKVKAASARGARLSYRTGYYESGSRMSDLERKMSLAEIMMTDAPIDDVAVSLAATTLPGPGGKARVPVVVQIPGGRLLEGVTTDTATASLYLYAFDSSDRVVDFLDQTIPLDVKKSGETIRGAGVRYFGTLRLPPGKYAIKALVRVEESGRAGFMRSDVEVPAFDKGVVLPPVLFSEPASWVTLVGPTRGDTYAYPFSAAGTTYVPQRSGELKADGSYTLALFFYGVALENLKVDPVVVNPDGSEAPALVKLLGRTPPDDRGGFKLLFDFKPSGLTGGNHELRFRVKQSDGTETVVAFPFKVV